MTNDNQLQNKPATTYLRLPQVLEIIPIGKSSWWAGVKSGRFPQSVKIGPRTTAWRMEDIQTLVDEINSTTRR
jgi:prophage regulatory protein